MYNKSKILLIEGCNYIDYPTGGQLTAAKHLLKSLGDRVALVGLTTDKKTKVGLWTKQNINGVEYDFFPALLIKHPNKKAIIPMRIQWYCVLRKFAKEIKQIDADYTLTQSIDSLYFALYRGFKGTVHCSAGLNNPFEYTRYKYSKPLSFIFERFWANQLKKASTLLVAADSKTIEDFKTKHRCLKDKTIISFPTRFDDNVFFPADSKNGKVRSNKTIVTVGRISCVKGWDFILRSFLIFDQNFPGYKLVFVGDGEDRSSLESMIDKYKCHDKILITGFLKPCDVARYLRNAELAVVGSHREGWCTAIVEALACGCKVVSTNVSAAEDMIISGTNGYIVFKHDIDLFAKAMAKAICLPYYPPDKTVHRLKLSKLSEDIHKYCKFEDLSL